MFDQNGFDSFVAELELAHFEASELLTKTDRPHNSPPDPSLWDNIGPTILVLDKLRAQFGVSIRLNSVYRTYDYNKRLPKSAKRSQHVAFNAIDFTTVSMSKRHLLDDFAQTLMDWRGDWFDAPRRMARKDVIVEGHPVPSRPLDWRDTGGPPGFRFRGGVSLYSTFVHIDSRGIDAGW